MVYKCVECDQHYCDSCDGGQDTCGECHVGPLCDDCAIEHTDMHREELNAEAADDDELEIDFHECPDFDPNDDYRK